MLEPVGKLLLLFFPIRMPSPFSAILKLNLKTLLEEGRSRQKARKYKGKMRAEGRGAEGKGKGKGDTPRNRGLDDGGTLMNARREGHLDVFCAIQKAFKMIRQVFINTGLSPAPISFFR